MINQESKRMNNQKQMINQRIRGKIYRKRILNKIVTMKGAKISSKLLMMY